jgi:archaemetzincin
MQKIVFLVIFFMFLLNAGSGEKEMKIYIVPLGSIEQSVLEHLKSKLTDVFEVGVVIEPAQPVPEYAYNKRRSQYLSSQIMNTLARDTKLLSNKVLAVIDKDLYVSGLNYVFGEADSNRGICIISLTRLRQSYWNLPKDRILFLERTLKEAVHEIGHLLDLRHCPDPRCVMHFSNSLQDTDIKGWQFCNQCKNCLP